MKEENINKATVSEEETTTIQFEQCEICKEIELRPINLSDTARILQVYVNLNNVCPNKTVVLSCSVVFNDNVIRQTQVFTLTDEDSCQRTRRFFEFVLPNTVICSPLDVDVTASVNYMNPCEPIGR